MYLRQNENRSCSGGEIIQPTFEEALFMSRVTLKMKMILGSLGMVVLVMILSTSVVSTIIKRQSRNASNELLEKALTIIRDDLTTKQQNLISFGRQAATADGMDAKVKYVYESKGSTDTGLTRSTYEEMVNVLAQIGMAGQVSSLSIYDIDGDLIAFFANRKDGYWAGYRLFGPKQSFRHVRLAAGEQIEPEAWQTDSLDELKLVTRFSGELPKKEHLFFDTIEQFVCITANVPVFGVDYSSGKPQDKQFGLAAVVLRLDHDFIAKMSHLTGTKINLFGSSGLSVGDLKEYAVLSADLDQTSMQGRALEQQPVILNEVDFESGGFFQGVLPLSGPRGQAGAIAALNSKQRVKENVWQIFRLLALVYLACMLLILPLVLFFSNSMTRPILKIVDGLTDISKGEGNLTRRLEVKGNDEIAKLAACFNEFVEKLQAMIQNIVQNAAELNSSTADLSKLSERMSQGADIMAAKASTVASATGEMSTKMTSVSAAMEEASANINMVATATEEMTATVNEIALNSERARSVTAEAVSQTANTSSKVHELGRAAQEIGTVTEAITEISEQTNLLALNATIEAARAGEAGKGFAVVANEIKELARQTAGATHEIKKRIEGIQDTTGVTVTEIEQISKVIYGVNEIVSTIASAVEEQAVTTREIASNISLASQKIQEVTGNIGQNSTVSVEIAKDLNEVNQQAGEISESSAKANQSTMALTRLSNRLRQMMDRFKI